MRLGIIGVGHLAASILTGLTRAGWDPCDICLSPRGHAPDLAQRHGYPLARDNADLVARCDLVLLAVRPKDAVSSVTGLAWREGQVLLSACAGVSRTALAPPPLPGLYASCRLLHPNWGPARP